MALFQSFHRPRKPRSFNHKPIYWDPKKEELEKRIARIRSEMIERGELPAEGVDEQAKLLAEQDAPRALSDVERRIRGSFLQGTSHLRSQRERGENASTRLQKVIKLLLLMIVAAAVVVALRQFNIFI